MTNLQTFCKTFTHPEDIKMAYSMNSPTTSKEIPQSPPNESIKKALELFKLPLPLDPTTLYQRYQELLVTWHPHRYANMTNNPSKYMQMYKKGQAMTKEVRTAYTMLKEWLDNQGNATSTI